MRLRALILAGASIAHGRCAVSTSAKSTYQLQQPLCELFESTAIASPATLIEAVSSSVTDAQFLSFEEWKAQNLAKKVRESESLATITSMPLSVSTAVASSAAQDPASLSMSSDNHTNIVEDTAQPARAMPNKAAFESAQKERFNHASFDCAASIILANKESKGASNILKANKDQYMLNVCSAPSKFVIVELCNDILVDTVQLANYEYFSGVMKEFSVQVAAKYPPGRDGWHDLGTFTAKSVRETQSFIVENPLIWARYVKVDMHSFYGSEFYCPLSLIRVFGKTMMEDLKQEVASEDGSELQIEPEVEAQPVLLNLDEAAQNLVTFAQELASNLPLVEENLVQPDPVHVAVEVVKPTPLAVSTAELSVCDVTTVIPVLSYPTNSAHIDPLSIRVSGQTTTTTSGETDTSSPASTWTGTPDLQNVTNGNSSRSAKLPTPPVTQESIYKQITKRLNLLEVNASLSLQYIESQSVLLAQSFARLSTAQAHHLSGFLDSINATVNYRLALSRTEHAQQYSEAIRSIEAARRRHESELAGLLHHFNTLSADVTFFKRLGILQMILMIVLIGFVVTSKTSAIDVYQVRRASEARLERDYRRALSPISWRDRVRSVSLAASPYRQGESRSPYLFPVEQIERPSRSLSADRQNDLVRFDEGLGIQIPADTSSSSSPELDSSQQDRIAFDVNKTMSHSTGEKDYPTPKPDLNADESI